VRTDGPGPGPADLGGRSPCLVEDYELVARLQPHAGDHHLPWRSRVLGDAQARTEARGTVAATRATRRWVGDPRRAGVAGAALGWAAFLRGSRRWGVQRRFGPASRTGR
jgi:hypothetical protein